MENEDIGQILSKIDRKLDKTLRMATAIAKALHIVPISEKEERDLQTLQRRNAAVMKKIQDEFAALDAVDDAETGTLSFRGIYDASEAEVYGDVIGDDYIKRG